MSQYPNSLKKQVCSDICFNKKSTIKMAEDFSIPLKTLEKWITAFNKNPNCFDEPNFFDFHFVSSPSYNTDFNYDDLSIDELKKLILKKDIELARLKKNYQVKGSGSGKKVFVTFSKKNMK